MGLIIFPYLREHKHHSDLLIYLLSFMPISHFDSPPPYAMILSIIYLMLPLTYVNVLVTYILLFFFQLIVHF